MPYVTALFHRIEQADQAVRDLQQIKVSLADVSIITAASNAESYIVDGTDELAGDGIRMGAALGGAAGLLAGAATLAIPGFGAAVVVGWIATAVMASLAGGAIGGVAGGIMGAAQGSGISRSDAHSYADAVRQGAVFVMARVSPERVKEAQSALGRNATRLAVHGST